MSITTEEWSILKMYLAKTKEGTIANLCAAYGYFKIGGQGGIYLRLLQFVKQLDCAEYAIFADQVIWPQEPR